MTQRVEINANTNDTTDTMANHGVAASTTDTYGNVCKSTGSNRNAQLQSDANANKPAIDPNTLCLRIIAISMLHSLVAYSTALPAMFRFCVPSLADACHERHRPMR